MSFDDSMADLSDITGIDNSSDIAGTEESGIEEPETEEPGMEGSSIDDDLAALLEMGEASPHYMMIVDRINNLDTLEVQVEVGEEFFSDRISELENLTKKIAHVIQQAIGLAVKVKLVDPKTIERSMGKAVHVIDKRKLV